MGGGTCRKWRGRLIIIGFIFDPSVTSERKHELGVLIER